MKVNLSGNAGTCCGCPLIWRGPSEVTRAERITSYSDGLSVCFSIAARNKWPRLDVFLF